MRTVSELDLCNLFLISQRVYKKSVFTPPDIETETDIDSDKVGTELNVNQC